jgi:regulator of sigma E protease
LTTTLLAFLFVLGVLIFVHELGHFLAARRHGVRVLTFSLGFGPKILKVTRGDTEYCISVIPLGGYVKMAGESPEDPRSGKPDEFLSKTKWQRFQILFAGPAMNIILAVVVLAFVFSQGARMFVYMDGPATIGAVLPGSPAAQAGLRRHDKVLTVGGREVRTWADLALEIGTRRPNRDVGLTLLRNDNVVSTTVRPIGQGRYEEGDIGVLPDSNPIIDSVIAGEIAESAGFKGGDVVLAINGEPVVTSEHFKQIVGKNGEREARFTVQRGDQQVDLRATPKDRGDGAKIGLYISDPTKSFNPGPLEALRMSIEQNITYSGLIFRTLGGLFTGATSVTQLQGPVGIAQLSGESAERGFIALLSLMAMLSINLGILNLMPVPVLDGGHILIMALEGIARRDFSMQVKEKMLLAGLVVLMMLMVTVIYNDLTRISWLERLMPWRN